MKENTKTIFKIDVRAKRAGLGFQMHYGTISNSEVKNELCVIYFSDNAYKRICELIYKTNNPEGCYCIITEDYHKSADRAYFGKKWISCGYTTKFTKAYFIDDFGGIWCESATQKATANWLNKIKEWRA